MSTVSSLLGYRGTLSFYVIVMNMHDCNKSYTIEKVIT